ncbi:threonine/homoserine/homoserine lactone efflux protein [Kitasatospora sp. MAA4]|uniref:hypothetical protein n=1 Tax=Kitasatospora sp. MAA4 TaxID=3035093 RepID=UPI002473E540|nr:hypothetical protein [Kitasatospora sp. MAA4]MDH6132010.1 threonine/homoserine/homoserine lactone efflux protein [Kitasatospora sp. MAA4]
MAALTRTQHPTTAGSTEDADGMAVASFILGLVGLLIFNVVLGPCALVLGALALHRGTARRGRALLGLTLGAADLVILAATVLSSHGTLWQLGA